MDTESRARLRRNLTAATDDALVALANRGLLRRATKDLQQAGSLTVEEKEVAVLVHGDGWTVTMPADGPIAATDTTPASGVTRHIITATLYLRDHWHAEGSGATHASTTVGDDSTEATMVAASQCLIDASTAELFRWSGKTPLLEASAALASVGDAVVSFSPHLTVEFSGPGVRVVLMTDRPASTLRRLLDQFKTTASKSEHPRWVMLAVLALKRSGGRETAIENDAGFELTDAIRDDRMLVARRVQKLIRSVAASGIAHPSSRIVERLRTTGVAAEAARFPRLASLLASIADDAQLQITRDAAADPTRMMQRMVVAHALSEAGSRAENAARVDLFGRARTKYSPAGVLQLSGLGAYGWRTASGFEGLTTIFWDLKSQRFLTASVARGEGQDRTFSIPQAYGCGLGWSGGAAVEKMCRSQLTLTDAKSNSEGRLSATEACRAELGELTDTSSLDFREVAIRKWSDLATRAQRSQPIGLRLPDPRASYVVIEPKQWGPRWFDELEQAFVWQLFDESAVPMEVRIPWTEVDELSIAFLESLKVERDHPTALLGRLVVAGGTMHVYPFSIFSSGTARGDKILCPQFDQMRIRSRNETLLTRLRKKFKREPVVETRISQSDVDELTDASAEDLVHAPPLLRSLVFDIDRILSAALESGTNVLNPAAERTLRECCNRLTSLGIGPLANSLSAALDSESPPSLLEAAYRLHLFRQVLTISQVLN